MRNWLRGRLFLFDLGFYGLRRFALINQNDGFFVSRLKTNANPLIVDEQRNLGGRAIPLRGTRLQQHLSELTRKYIDVTGGFTFKRRHYGEHQSTDGVAFRVVGVRNVNTDDYHLYVTDLPDEFTPEQIAALYRLRWKVELLFRELKSRYGLEKFETSNPAIVELLPEERWATTFRSIAHLILADLGLAHGHPPPNLPEVVRQEARQPEKSRLTLNKRVAQTFYAEVRP